MIAGKSTVEVINPVAPREGVRYGRGVEHVTYSMMAPRYRGE